MAAPMLPPFPYEVPAAPAPPGQTSDLNSPETNKNIAVVTLSIFIALATLFVALRIYVRFVGAASRGWDDLCIILALPPQVAYTGIVIWMAESGIIARHIWNTPLGVVLFKLPRWATVIAVLPEFNILMVKLSILFLYYRLFSPNRITKWLVVFGMVINTMVYTAWFFTFIFLSQEVLSSASGARLADGQAAFGVASDFYILALPIYSVSKLHIRTKKKIGIIAIFMTGLAACAMSVLTLYYRFQYTGAGPDPTYQSTTRITVSCLEIDIGIMCACMPLFAHYTPSSKRLEQWLTTWHSMRSGLFRSRGSERSGNSTRSGFTGTPSDGKNSARHDVYETPGPYLELDNRNTSIGDEESSVSALKRERGN